MKPSVPVKYWRHPLGARVLLEHSICVTLMVKAAVPALLAGPKLALSVLHVEHGLFNAEKMYAIYLKY
jgi:hypothetical protein